MTNLSNIKNHTPKVSVIIPLYNKAQYIKRTLDSVLSQTIDDIEIIVIGGNSTDGGEKIVREYSDSRIHLIKEVGKGVSSARNQGVGEAKSELIAFLDADDEWMPEHLEVILGLRNKYPCAKIFGTGYQMIAKQKIHLRTLKPEIGDRFIQSYYEERVKAGIRNQFLLMSGMAVSKQLFLKIGGFNTNLVVGEDLDLYERLSVYSGIAYAPEMSVVYYNDLPNNTRHLFPSLPPISWESIDELCETVREHNDSKLTGCLRYAQMMYSTIGFGNAIRGYRKESIHVWKKVKFVNYPQVRIVSYALNILPDCIREIVMKVWYGL